MREPCSIISTSTDDKELSQILALQAIEKRLAGCVQVISSMTSYYRWQDKIENAQEHLLLFKTTGRHEAALMHMIKTIHAYETPEIIMTKIAEMDHDYQKWLKSSIS